MLAMAIPSPSPIRIATAGTAPVAGCQAIVRQCLHLSRPGAYHIQAAIQAVHSDPRSAAATDWSQIVQLYDQLLAFDPAVDALGGVTRIDRLRDNAGDHAAESRRVRLGPYVDG
jgi:predicted RNA polymerase sigma factor